MLTLHQTWDLDIVIAPVQTRKLPVKAIEHPVQSQAVRKKDKEDVFQSFFQVPTQWSNTCCLPVLRGSSLQVGAGQARREKLAYWEALVSMWGVSYGDGAGSPRSPEKAQSSGCGGG